MQPFRERILVCQIVLLKEMPSNTYVVYTYISIYVCMMQMRCVASYFCGIRATLSALKSGFQILPIVIASKAIYGSGLTKRQPAWPESLRLEMTPVIEAVFENSYKCMQEATRMRECMVILEGDFFGYTHV